MIEPWQGEIQDGASQSLNETLKPLKEAVEKSAMRAARNQPHSEEEKVKIAAIAEELKKPAVTSKFKKETEELSKIIPEQEAVRKEREEAGGVKIYLQLRGEIDTRNVVDQRLNGIAESFNRRSRRDLVVLETIEQTIRDIEEVQRDPALSEADWIWADNVVEELANNLVELRERRRREIEEQQRYGQFYGERKLTDQEKQLIRTGRKVEGEREVSAEEDVEELFNRMFDRVDTNPKEDFNRAFGTAGTLEYEEFMRTLLEVTSGVALGEVFTPEQKERARRLIERYSEERKLRETTHNVNYAILVGVGTQRLAEFAQQFQSAQEDLAFSKKGVVEASHFYEQALLKVRAENGGYLPEDDVIGKPEEGIRGRVEDLTRQYLQEHFIGENALKDWEINRAVSIARGLHILNGSSIEIATSSILPGGRGGPLSPRFGSMYAQDIIQHIAPFRHGIYKYDIGIERNRVFAFLLNRGRSPWNKKELESFDWSGRIDIINGLVGDKEERFLGVLNPLRVGGIFSRTTWRIGDDPTVGAIGDFVRRDPDNINWIGTGIAIERLRGRLMSEGQLRQRRERISRITDKEIRRREEQRLSDDIRGAGEAEQNIREVLQKVTTIQPLKLFYNIPEVQDEVQKGLRGQNFKLEDLKNDAQLKEYLDKLTVLQENAIKNKLSQLEFEDTEEGRRLIDFAQRIRDSFLRQVNGKSRLDTYVENLRDREWKLPFVFGTEDVPFNEYDFSKTGANSIARRWRDIEAARITTTAMIELVNGMSTFKAPEQIMPIIQKIYNGIAQYDEPLAREVIMKISQGIIRFYGKDWFARLPFGIGTLVGMITGRTSYAEAAFGRGAMSWDELGVNEFTRLIRDSGDLSLEQQHELQRMVGGGRKEATWAYARLIVPLILLAFFYYMAQRTVSQRQ